MVQVLIPTSHAKLDEFPFGPTHWGQGPSKNWGGPAQLDPLLKKELKMQVCLLTNRTQNTQHSKCKFSFGHVESLELAMARCRRHRRKWRRKGWRIRARQRRGPMISVFLGSSRDFWMAMVKDDLSVWAKFTLGLIQCASLIHPWVTSSNSSSSA